MAKEFKYEDRCMVRTIVEGHEIVRNGKIEGFVTEPGETTAALVRFDGDPAYRIYKVPPERLEEEQP